MSEIGTREIVIFYSWQSDREGKCCKDFIRIAADEAADAVAAKLGVLIRIDSDTEGVSGHPAITDTILKKIEASDLFLADMSFVAETTGGKLVPNPNVMGEYGFALRAKTVQRILLAMNTGGLFQIQQTIGRRIDDDPDIPVPGQEIEAHLVNAIDRAAKVAAAVGLSGPALVGASLEGLEGVEIHRSRGRTRRLKKNSAGLGIVKLEALSAPTADGLRRLMDQMWLVGGRDDGSHQFVDGRWTGYDDTGGRPS